MAIKVLFVDDDAAVLRGLRDELVDFDDHVTARFTTSAARALALIQRHDVDVIVSDMRMPDIDGVELLRKVQKIRPKTARIVLSGNKEYEATLRALPVAHHFLLKPAECEAIVEIALRGARVQRLVGDADLCRSIGEITGLPPAPKICTELRELLAGPDAGLKAVAALLEQEPTLTAKLIHMVNSAAFGLRQRVDDVGTAVRYLGMRTIEGLVASVEAYEAMQTGAAELGMSPDALQDHSLCVGRLARSMLPGRAGETAFLAGLVHDIGRLVLAVRAPEGCRTVHAAGACDEDTLVEREAEVIGATHADAGALLLHAWNFPGEVVECVAVHPHATKARGARFNPVAAVHLADAFIEQAERGGGELPKTTARMCQTMGLGRDDLKQWRAAADKLAA